MDRQWSGLPGADLIAAGIADLESGIESIPALLVAVGSPRLSSLGLDMPNTPAEGLRQAFDAAEPQLYRYPALDPASCRSAVEAALGHPG